MNFTCPCCGYRTLRNKGEYDICPICFWEDDHYQEQAPYSSEGANHISLIEGQINYRRFGACDNTCIKHVRKPTLDDEYDSNWIPLITSNQAFIKWINKKEKLWEEQGIFIEDIKVVTEQISDNPCVTVYHYSKNKIGVITVWEGNTFYYEIEECNNGNTLLLKNDYFKALPNFDETFSSYFKLMNDNSK